MDDPRPMYTWRCSCARGYLTAQNDAELHAGIAAHVFSPAHIEGPQERPDQLIQSDAVIYGWLA